MMSSLRRHLKQIQEEKEMVVRVTMVEQVVVPDRPTRQASRFAEAN